jgi:hypothetical protein
VFRLHSRLQDMVVGSQLYLLPGTHKTQQRQYNSNNNDYCTITNIIMLVQNICFSTFYFKNNSLCYLRLMGFPLLEISDSINSEDGNSLFVIQCMSKIVVIRYSSCCNVSEEHLVGLFMSVCLSVAFFVGEVVLQRAHLFNLVTIGTEGMCLWTTYCTSVCQPKIHVQNGFLTRILRGFLVPSHILCMPKS